MSVSAGEDPSNLLDFKTSLSLLALCQALGFRDLPAGSGRAESVLTLVKTSKQSTASFFVGEG